MQERHVNYADIGKHTAASFGHTKATQSLTELVNSPPLALMMSEKQLLALMVYQQSAVIALLNDVRQAMAGVRRDIKSEQKRVASARYQAAEKAARAEEKAAKARERAAIAEREAAEAAQPPVMIQAGGSLRSLESRIKRKF